MNQNNEDRQLSVFEIDANDDETDVVFLEQAYAYHQQLVAEENCLPLTRNLINRDREGAEERLIADYFNDLCSKHEIGGCISPTATVVAKLPCTARHNGGSGWKSSCCGGVSGGGGCGWLEAEMMVPAGKAVAVGVSGGGGLGWWREWLMFWWCSWVAGSQGEWAMVVGGKRGCGDEQYVFKRGQG
nr:hypothetical protein [Tanacetum cinerariifolium]